MKEHRKSVRLNHSAEINMIFSSGETLKARTRNLSDGGLLIHCPNHPALSAGDSAEIVALGIQDAVPRPVKIIRTDSKGAIAVEFVNI